MACASVVESWLSLPAYDLLQKALLRVSTHVTEAAVLPDEESND